MVTPAHPLQTPHLSGCADAIAPRVSPTGDMPPVMVSHTACAYEVEAYAVKPVEAEGSVRASAQAGVGKLAPGPLPGAGIRGIGHFTL
jgi:hypothetical protein